MNDTLEDIQGPKHRHLMPFQL